MCLAQLETSLGTDASIKGKMKTQDQIWHLHEVNFLRTLSIEVTFRVSLMADSGKTVKSMKLPEFTISLGIARSSSPQLLLLMASPCPQLTKTPWSTH